MSEASSLRGLTAHDRHLYKESVYDPDAARAKAKEARRLANARTDFDVLKEAHRFIRDEDDSASGGRSTTALAKDQAYADAVAKRYEDSLFKEFALIDQKHWRSGRVALRWRTMPEVLELIGEETCGSLRCAYHIRTEGHPPPPLSTFELPFAYEEAGIAKQALVKVVLCSRCAKKLKPPRTDDQASHGSSSGSRRQVSAEPRRSSSPKRSSTSTSRSRHQRDDSHSLLTGAGQRKRATEETGRERRRRRESRDDEDDDRRHGHRHKRED